MHNGWSWNRKIGHWPWNVKSSHHNTTQSWRSLGKSVTIYILAAALFCNKQSLLRTVLDHLLLVAVQKLKVSHSHLFCCRDLVSAWEHNLGTLPVQLQRWRPRDWQDYACSQDKQDYLRIMAGVELEKYAIGHEMSNQQSEKQSLANTTQSWIDCIRNTCGYLQLCSFTFLHCTIFT